MGDCSAGGAREKRWCAATTAGTPASTPLPGAARSFVSAEACRVHEDRTQNKDQTRRHTGTPECTKTGGASWAPLDCSSQEVACLERVRVWAPTGKQEGAQRAGGAAQASGRRQVRPHRLL